MDPLQLCPTVAHALWVALCVALGAGFGAATTIWHLFRRTRYLSAALANEQQRRISDANETWRIASTAFASGKPISLEDLLNKREADFAVKSSKK